MSIDVAGTDAAAREAAEPPNRTRRIVVGVVLVVLLAVLASMLTYRQTVRSERQGTFEAVRQMQLIKAYDALGKVGFGQFPADSVAMSDLLQLELVYPQQGHRVTVSTPRMRLGGETQMLQLDVEGSNLDLPGWVGDRYQFVSMLLLGTYTNDENGATSDVGGCVIRVGSPYEPVLTETVPLSDGYLATPCTPEQLSRYGIS